MKPFFRNLAAACRVGEPLDVDEVRLLVQQLGVERVRIGAEELPRGDCNLARRGKLGGSANTVVVCTPRARSAPLRSKIVPRQAGGPFSCSRCACAELTRRLTTCSQPARASVAAKRTAKTTKSRRIRRLAFRSLQRSRG